MMDLCAARVGNRHGASQRLSQQVYTTEKRQCACASFSSWPTSGYNGRLGRQAHWSAAFKSPASEPSQLEREPGPLFGFRRNLP